MGHETPVRDRFFEEIKSRIRPQQFDTWFRKINVSRDPEGNFVLHVPSEVWRGWLKAHYISAIREAACAVASGPADVTFRVDPSLSEPGPKEPETVPSTPPPKEARGERLNPRYTFENFVVGPSNRFAHAAAMAVAESPSRAYNPLYIYGSVGMGKTHLIQAVCQACLASRVRTRVIYVPCEAFLNHYVAAVQKRSLEGFRKRYRQADLLVIDDIHFLSNKERSQEEFFHTFNTLYNADRQIILSSDSAPKTLRAMEERLVSRFRWGLVAKLDAPVYETRAAIVHKKTEMYGGELPDDVVEYLASSAEGNIRDLEGSVIRIIGYASLTGRKIDVELAAEVMEEKPRRPRAVTLEDVLGAVTDVFGIKAADVQSKKRTRTLVRPRHVCMYLARKLTDHSLEEIGRYLGGRDHSTVVYAQERVETELSRDKGFKRTVDEVLCRLGGD